MSMNVQEKEELLGFLDEWIENNGSVVNNGIIDAGKLEKFMKDFGGYIDELDYTPINGGHKLILYAGEYGDLDMWKFAQK